MKGLAPTYRFADFTLTTGDRRLSRNGSEIYLRPKTYDTLLYLLERQGHLVTKNDLLQALWSDTAVTDNALTRCVKEIRAALNDDVQDPRFLRTVPRLGYEFIADVQECELPGQNEVVEEEFRAVHLVTTEDESAAHELLATPTSTVQTARVPNKKRTVAAVLAFAALVVVALLAANFGGWRNRLLGRSTPPRIRSLAVLPLHNMTGDPSQEYFADGMTQELIATLGNLAKLRVISLTSVMPYKQTNKSLPQIAKELNVDAVIEGSVARAGNRVRITTQLVQASNDQRLWGKTYDHDLRDVLSLQSDVARDIAAEVSGGIAAGNQVRSASSRVVNPEAYAFYLQGQARRTRATESDNAAAIQSLKTAISIDPAFAPGYAALGRAYADRLFAWDTRDEIKQNAEAAIDKALSLDPDLAEAHVSRAALLFTPAHGWQYEAAIQECKRALELNPNLAEAHLTLGGVFFHVGLLEEAIQEFRAAAAISPSLAETGLYTGFSHFFSGRFEEAQPFFRSAGGMPYAKVLQAYGHWELGQNDDAERIVRDLLRADPQEKFVYLACIHALLLASSGNSREAEIRIGKNVLPQAEGLKPYGHFHHVAMFVAQSYAQMHRPEEAVRWLETTVASGFPCYPFFEHDRALDPIRNDPRFVAFMQKLKPQWEHLRLTYGTQPH